DGEIDEFIQLADMNGDGMIQFEEFVKWLYGSSATAMVTTAPAAVANFPRLGLEDSVSVATKRAVTGQLQMSSPSERMR
ncbi:unnamed protein product, partial [Symbiodinium sp. CCMP2456]